LAGRRQKSLCLPNCLPHTDHNRLNEFRAAIAHHQPRQSTRIRPFVQAVDEISHICRNVLRFTLPERAANLAQLANVKASR